MLVAPLDGHGMPFFRGHDMPKVILRAVITAIHCDAPVVPLRFGQALHFAPGRHCRGKGLLLATHPLPVMLGRCHRVPLRGAMAQWRRLRPTVAADGDRRAIAPRTPRAMPPQRWCGPPQAAYALTGQQFLVGRQPRLDLPASMGPGRAFPAL